MCELGICRGHHEMVSTLSVSAESSAKGDPSPLVLLTH